MIFEEIIDAVPADVQKKVNASIDVRQNAVVFGGILKQHVPENALKVRGKDFDTIYASIVSLDARDVGAPDRLKGYIQQLIKLALQLGAEMANVEKTYIAFWR